MLQPDGANSEPESRPTPPPPALKPALAPELPANLRAGAKLKAAREAMGLTLEEVSSRLRISRDYLVALEAMNLKLIPGKAYARAFAKSYARLVGLDPEAIVAQFEDENALTREDVAPQIRNPASKPARERPYLAAAGIAAAITAFIGWQIIAADGREDRLVQSGPAAALVEPVEPPTAAAAAPVVVEIRALSSAWLEVRGPDGTIFISQVVEPGQAYRPDVGAGWTIHARDGGAFEVAIAGQPGTPLGKPGAPVLGRAVDALVEIAAAKAAEAAAARENLAAAAKPAPAAVPPAAAPAAPAAAPEPPATPEG